MHPKRCLQILQESRDEPEVRNWSSIDGLEVRFVEPEWFEIEMIENVFRATCSSFVITDVRRIESPFIMAEFMLKKREACTKFRIPKKKLNMRLMYHGTSSECVERIARDNFDPKLCVQHKYGWGVSFSPDPYYASHYAAKRSGRRTDHMEMILANVITTRTCLGRSDMMSPPTGYDTTRSPNGKVYVKYEPHTFYPAYKIEYVEVDDNVFRFGTSNTHCQLPNSSWNSNSSWASNSSWNSNNSWGSNVSWNSNNSWASNNSWGPNNSWASNNSSYSSDGPSGYWEGPNWMSSPNVGFPAGANYFAGPQYPAGMTYYRDGPYASWR